ncbi:MAG: hypothetical protein R2850_13425 [Bacteroidia bacterium]
MNRLIVILMLICSDITLKAEYNKYLIQIELTLNDSEKLICHADISEHEINEDSIKYPDYLMRKLPETMIQAGDSFQVYKEIFYYHYLSEYSDKTVSDSILVKDQLIKLPLSAIIKIKFIDYRIYSYLQGLSKELHVSDSSWFHLAPVKSFRIGGYLCTHQIFIHEMNPETEAWMKELIRIDEILGKRLNSEESELFDADQYDKEIGEILMKCENNKVVIVSECTC